MMTLYVDASLVVCISKLILVKTNALVFMNPKTVHKAVSEVYFSFDWTKLQFVKILDVIVTRNYLSH